MRTILSLWRQCPAALFSALLGAVVLLLQVAPPARALVYMDKAVPQKEIDTAIRYGLSKRGQGFESLLDKNWKEGRYGAFLNVYTPFMQLAAKAYGSGLPRKPTQEDLKTAYKLFKREIRFLKDPQTTKHVKFSVALYGDDPRFGLTYRGWIEGVGRGKETVLQPAKSVRQREANRSEFNLNSPYEVINSYYFKFKDINNLDDYRFIIEDEASGRRVEFPINNQQLL
ncbi:MAG: hypothetical protein SFZ03_07435 [Candidatus Melainabacteria bacterium]|nr:hypothetical protein [Candidatus Melainabacteria bacterium]